MPAARYILRYAKCDMLCSAQRYIFSITYEFRNVGTGVLDGPPMQMQFGLSGGRSLIGAVTYVLVNDPTTGYGIFIENMLDAAA